MQTAKPSEDVMKYRVRMIWTVAAVLTIDADSPDEARSAARVAPLPRKDFYSEIDEVEVIDSIETPKP